MVTVKELLKGLDLGKSVAEFDEDLEQYFVETNTFRELIQDRVDIIAGDKGTGKTAIYRFIQKKYADYPELEGVNMLAAFNPSGNPIFSSLKDTEPCDEADYILLWKSYILAIVGNWILEVGPDKLKDSTLDKMLTGLGLRSKSYEPRPVWERILSKLPNFFQWKSAEVKLTASESGMPIVVPRVEFGKSDSPPPVDERVSVEDSFKVLDSTLAETGAVVWVNFDRLDEAFQGRPEIEVPALRALLRTYLDLYEFKEIRLKLFLRKDLFRRITTGGFVNLTHINAKKLEIVWDEEDLLNLFCRRVRKNGPFVDSLGLKDANDAQIFDRIFPDQVDFGLRKPKTWVWMMRRIRDGNDIKPPRNLIDLIKFSQQAQLRKEDRETRELTDEAIIEADALRRGLSQLSENRVNDTLLAEAGVFAPLIERFRDGKAEHNLESLGGALGIAPAEAKVAAKPLVELGFLEEVKGTYKIPALYREGLSVTQGKAFSDEPSDEEDA